MGTCITAVCSSAAALTGSSATIELAVMGNVEEELAAQTPASAEELAAPVSTTAGTPTLPPASAEQAAADEVLAPLLLAA